MPHFDKIEPQAGYELRDYGLAPAKMRVILQGDEDLPEYLIGRETATPGGIYLKVKGRPEIYVVSQDVRDVVNQPNNFYRDRTLTDLQANLVDRIIIGSQHGQIELLKRQGNWRIDTPINARANNRMIDELARMLVNAQIIDFADEDSATLGSMGLAEPAGVLTLYKAGSDEPRVLQIGKPAKPGTIKNEPEKQVYTRYPNRDGLYRMDQSIANLVELTPNQLRDRFVARFNMDVVDRVRIQSQNGSEIKLQRGPMEWSMIAPYEVPANGRKIMDLLELLRTTEVIDFVEDSSARLELYGLDQPERKIVVSSYISENIPDAGSGEHPLVELAIGHRDEDRGGIYARLESEPFVVSIPVELAALITTKAKLWKSLEILPDAADEISELQFSEAGRMVHFTRVEGSWQINGQPLPDSLAIESCANTLSGLRAVRRIEPADIPQEQLVEPRIIRFKLSDKWYKLEITGKTFDGYQIVKLVGANEYFLVSQPDFGALNVPLPDLAQPTVITQDVVDAQE